VTSIIKSESTSESEFDHSSMAGCERTWLVLMGGNRWESAVVAASASGKGGCKGKLGEE
jgi:hypothetical protein